MVPRLATLIGSDLWVDTAEGRTRLNRDLSVRTVYRGRRSALRGDVFGESATVWLRDSGGTIYRIEAGSGRVIERITPDPVLSAGSLLVAFVSIWVTGSEEGTVIRLRLSS